MSHALTVFVIAAGLAGTPANQKAQLAKADLDETSEIVTYDALADVKAADAATFAYLVARDGAHGAGWSDIYTSENGQQFGICYAPDIDTFIDSTHPKEKKVKKTKWKQYEESVIP